MRIHVDGASKPKRIYIAGPMTGIPEHNFPAFHAAAAFFRSCGFEVENPAENFGGETGHPRELYMRQDLKMLTRCDAIALLPGWEKSRGATLEVHAAREMGLDFYEATTGISVPAPEQEIVNDPDTAAAVTVRQEAGSAAAKVIRNGDFVVKDSGDRTRFSTGAQRDAQAGKGFFHCIPFVAVERLAQLYEAGAQKYGKDNWKKGIPLSRYVDAMHRHAFKLAENWLDEDHAAAVMWNAAGYIWTVTAIRAGSLPAELDDLGHVARPVGTPT